MIQRLARDAADVVACPVLEFSPLLSDLDLLEIIERGGDSGRLTAISRRHGVGEQVADAIVATQNEGAITALLDNGSAQIREEALDGLVAAALEVSVWQEPLVRRPRLPSSAARKLAGFVASSLLDLLNARNDLDRETASLVAREVERRIGHEAAETAEKGRETANGEGETDKTRARRMFEAGELDDRALMQALNGGDRGLVRHGVALRADLPLSLIDHVLAAHSAKGVTALAVTPGFLRSEAMLDGFGVREESWRDAIPKARGFEESETPCYVGRAVAALAADPNVHAKTAGVYASWTLAKEYGFRDVDGRQPDWAGYVTRSVNEILDRGIRDPGERFWVTTWYIQLHADPRWKVLTERIAHDLDL